MQSLHTITQLTKAAWKTHSIVRLKPPFCGILIGWEGGLSIKEKEARTK